MVTEYTKILHIDGVLRHMQLVSWTLSVAGTTGGINNGSPLYYTWVSIVCGWSELYWWVLGEFRGRKKNKLCFIMVTLFNNYIPLAEPYFFFIIIVAYSSFTYNKVEGVQGSLVIINVGTPH